MTTNILFSNSDNCYCSLNVSVSKNLKDKRFIIKYEYDYGIEKNSIRLSRFQFDKLFNQCKLGCSAPINELTEHQIKYLFMDDSELSNIIGNTDPTHYKKMILFQLSLFQCISNKNIKSTEEYFCKVNISLDQKKYNKLGDTYYYIYYNYIYGSNSKSKELNPFYNHFKEHIEGEIIIKNSLSELLIKYLHFNDESLSKETECIDPKHYKK